MKSTSGSHPAAGALQERIWLLAIAGLAAVLLSASWMVAPGFCGPGDQLKLPTARPTPRASKAPPQEDDILLLMAAGGTEEEDVQKALKEVHGTVVGTIGEGPLTILKVKCEKGKIAQTEKKLGKDKNFCAVQRNFMFQVEQTAPVNDPYFPQEWHLSALNAVRAWQVSLGGRNILGVLDTGCNQNIADLKGKTYAGYDATTRRNGQKDLYGHGTMVATTAAAITNNGKNTAAPARLSYIYPVKVSYSSSGYISESAILEAIYKCGRLGIKIINMSFNANPPYSLANPTYHPALHTYLRWYHDSVGGLAFNSAGNSGTYDSSPAVPYLIVVSAISTNYSLAYFSTYGTPTWFTGPGVGVYCSTKSGGVASVSGTSFSSPLCASVAALVWGARPGLRNTDVENILRSTCYTVPGYAWTPYYGYGMPNAEAAVRAATGN
ncbi:MAG: S8 family serine peptidase [Candidatus Melainabacteria bacterium]|nr:S8 family serine peptidase [Candidatus Melainabacteria bacterium]